jgi:drug/metabolite transporter (DMT)-like permease
MTIRERPRPATLSAICLSMAGVAIMVGGAFGPNDLIGDVLSALMALSFAATIVLARAHPDLPMSAVTALSMLMIAVLALPWAALAPGWPSLGLLALFGVGQMGIGSLLFAAGARRIPAADAGLFSVLALFGVGQMGIGGRDAPCPGGEQQRADAGLFSVLETVLGPLWVWLAVNERPDPSVLAGGGLVLAAVLMAGLMEQRGRVAA